MKRFKNLDKLTAFLGLVPDCNSSGDKERDTGISKRYQKYLRYLLVESAWIAIRKDPALTLAFSNLTKKKDNQKAIIKITKKLVNRMRCVWLNQIEYSPSVIQ